MPVTDGTPAAPAGTPATTPAAGTPAGAPAAAAPVGTPAAGDQATPAAAVAGTPAAADQAAAAPAGDPAAASDQAAPAPKDWAAIRSEIAGEDEKLLKRLSRYGSVKDVADALIAAQNKIASGSLKSALPADATPEQLAEWRAENGVPAKPEEYDTTLPNGMVVGELDKPVVDGFAKTAHELNMNSDQVKQTLSWYFAEQEKQMTALRQADIAFANEATEELRAEWGSEFKLNLNLIDGLISQAPEGSKELLMGARLADGTPLASNPKIQRWLATLAREVNPTATVVPGTGATAVQAIESELASIVGLMRDKNSTYWKGPAAEKMQARYRELVDVQGKLKK